MGDVKLIDATPHPLFRWRHLDARASVHGTGFTVLYSDQCPYEVKIIGGDHGCHQT